MLLLVADDMRPDALGILNQAPIKTPHLDTLARRGVLMTRAVCPNPICTPSRAEILSGCSGFRNGVLDFARQIDPSLPTWAHTMRQAGYHTWYVGKWHNDGRPNLRGYEESRGLYAGGGGQFWQPRQDANGHEVTGYRGWIFQTDDGQLFPAHGVGLTPDISRRFADAAIELIRRPGERPFFLHVNFTAPHDPLLWPPGFRDQYPPERMPLPGNFLAEHPFDHGNLRGRDEQLWPWPRTAEDVRAELAVYYAVIAHLDQQIGRIFDALRDAGRLEDTLIVFTADHGLAIGSHGLRGKQNMYEHTVGVPLVLAGSGLPAGVRRDAQVYLRDLYPTVCQLCGIEVPRQVEGRSMLPVLRGEEDSLYAHVFCYFRDSQRMIRDDRWKLIHYPQAKRYQMFDLRQDPLELRDLSADPRHAERFGLLRTQLEAEQRAAGDPLLAAGSPPPAR
ncbi:MAG: sulfatase-like hydrolase/transferase [Pirellulaceae bacterium]|nr:sulfatase-like hydrolase/transferase [Pirellulaceae bacterium]